MNKMKTLILFVLLNLVVSSPAIIFAQETFGKLNPAAPEETAQFQFLVGRWHAEYSGISSDGTVTKGTADWRIKYILNGFALQDEWSYSLPDGTIAGYGTMFRTFDAKKKEWTIVEQTTGNLEFNHMTAKKVGDTMVMYEEGETPEGKIHMRRVFHNITRDSFDWRYDISRDGGKTWQENVARMKCTRVK